MVLGFHYHIPAKSVDGNIITSGFLGRFIDSLANNVTELVCFMHCPLPSEEFFMDYRLKAKNVKLVSMGPHVSVPKRILRSHLIMKNCMSELGRLDCLLIRCPTPLLPALASFDGVKKAFLIVGDYAKSSQDLNQPFFRKRQFRFGHGITSTSKIKQSGIIWFL